METEHLTCLLRMKVKAEPVKREGPKVSHLALRWTSVCVFLYVLYCKDQNTQLGPHLSTLRTAEGSVCHQDGC